MENKNELCEKNNKQKAQKITQYTFTDLPGKIAITSEEIDNTIKPQSSNSLEDCKNKCIHDNKCAWIQYNGVEKNCYLFPLGPKDECFLQWKDDNEHNNVVYGYNLLGSKSKPTITLRNTNFQECNEKCREDTNCLYSVYEMEEDLTSTCDKYYYIENKNYVLSYINEINHKLELQTYEDIICNIPQNVENPEEKKIEDTTRGNDNKMIGTISMYGFTIIILVIIAIILLICKKRSDKEKLLLYTLSNAANNVQTRSRSKSNPSETGSYINSNSLHQNSSITINPESMDGQKFKSLTHSASSYKKSSRRSVSSRAPSIHSITTLCNNNNLNNNQGDTQNDKSHHNLSLSTKKSSYNYSIKTFSAKDPSLTGLSHNIKTLFANSYSNSNSMDNNSFYDTYSSLSNSPKIEPANEPVYKDNTSFKNLYNNNHKKQSSSISIEIPKVGSSSSLSSPNKNNSSQTTKLVKIKKPVHTKQFSLSRDIYSDTFIDMNTNLTEISIQNNDEIDKSSISESPENLSFNTSHTTNNSSTDFLNRSK